MRQAVCVCPFDSCCSRITAHMQHRSLHFLETFGSDSEHKTQDARRLGPMHKAPDPRVDVALYFCNPHRIKEMDVTFMARVSEVVPVIPILAKVGRECNHECKPRNNRKIDNTRNLHAQVSNLCLKSEYCCHIPALSWKPKL